MWTAFANACGLLAWYIFSFNFSYLSQGRSHTLLHVASVMAMVGTRPLKRVEGAVGELRLLFCGSVVTLVCFDEIGLGAHGWKVSAAIGVERRLSLFFIRKINVRFK